MIVTSKINKEKPIILSNNFGDCRIEGTLDVLWDEDGNVDEVIGFEINFEFYKPPGHDMVSNDNICFISGYQTQDNNYCWDTLRKTILEITGEKLEDFAYAYCTNF